MYVRRSHHVQQVNIYEEESCSIADKNMNELIPKEE